MQSKSKPESVLLKEKRDADMRTARAEEAAKKDAAEKSRQGDAFKRAEKYMVEYQRMEKDLVALRRAAKATGRFFVEPDAKVAFVVRIRGIMGVAPKTRKILQLLRLRQIHNGVFVRLNKATLQMLNLVTPYIAWGYPNLKTIRSLMLKRGFGKLGKAPRVVKRKSKMASDARDGLEKGYDKLSPQRIALSDNRVVETALGHLGVICIEDIVHELFTCGPHFKEVSNFLWPFKLSSPSGGFSKKLLHYNEKGEAGNREDRINKLVQRML